jgi:hypothetical protein
LKENTNKLIKQNKSNIDKEIEVTTTSQSNINSNSVNELSKKTSISLSEYNFNSMYHIEKKYMSLETSFNTIVSDEELKNLAINTQNSISKIKKINQVAKYYINSDDIVGKVHETIENNVNPKIKLNFPNIKGRNKQKIKDEAEKLINNFNASINVKKLLRKGIPSTYDEGNYFMYLRNNNGNYKVDIYPIGIIEVSDYSIDDENLCVMNMAELVSRINNTGLSMGGNAKLFNKTLADEIKNNYPPEVFEAYINKQIYAKLNILNTGHVSINSNGGRYGLSPLFRVFKSLRTYEIYEKTNTSNAKAKAKKILTQVLSDKMLGKDGTDDLDEEKFRFAHTNFEQSYKASVNADLTMVTLPPWVLRMEYVEPNTADVSVDIVNQQRNKVLSALGIAFLANESKSSFNTVEVSVLELKKTIDKISSSFADVLSKWYTMLLLENSIPLDYLPEVEIESSANLDIELKLKMADILYSKLGCSYKTSMETLGINFENELQRREEENEYKTKDTLGNDAIGMDIVFSPHLTSYVSSSDSATTDTTGKNKEILNKDKDQQAKNANDYKKKQ